MLLHERISEAVQSAQDRGHSISKIAEDCGISRQAIYQWKDGSTSMLDGTNLVILSDLSGYYARWIIKGTGPKKLDDDPPLTQASPQQLTAELMRRLAPNVDENSELNHNPKAKASTSSLK
jgi:hypothetical protein